MLASWGGPVLAAAERSRQSCSEEDSGLRDIRLLTRLWPKNNLIVQRLLKRCHMHATKSMLQKRYAERRYGTEEQRESGLGGADRQGRLLTSQAVCTEEYRSSVVRPPILGCPDANAGWLSALVRAAGRSSERLPGAPAMSSPTPHEASQTRALLQARFCKEQFFRLPKFLRMNCLFLRHRLRHSPPGLPLRMQEALR